MGAGKLACGFSKCLQSALKFPFPNSSKILATGREGGPANKALDSKSHEPPTPGASGLAPIPDVRVRRGV